MDLFGKVMSIIAEPAKFFGHLKKESGVKEAFVYLLVMSLIGTVLAVIGAQLFHSYSSWLIQKMFGTGFPTPKHSFMLTALMGVIGYLLGLGFSFVWAGLLHVWMLVFGGKEGYGKTYQLYVYTRTPKFIFGWIPGVSILAWFYSILLLIIGTHKVHNISKLKAALMYIVPLIILIVMILVLLSFILAFSRNLPPDFWKTALYS